MKQAIFSANRSQIDIHRHFRQIGATIIRMIPIKRTTEGGQVEEAFCVLYVEHT